MKFKILWYYIIGYVRVEIEGYFIERLINLSLRKSILLWNSKRKKSTLLYTNVSIKDFKILAKIAKESKCRIKIKEKRGLPFIFHRYKKRKIFFIFLFLVIVGIITLSNFVWNIQVEGNINISKDEILESLNNEGLYIGKNKNDINTKEIINKMRLNRNDLAWMGIEIKGTNVIVKIVESSQKPEIIKEDEYCNIVATKAGTIVKINAINGTSLVKEGDVINEGTVLIGGWLEGKYTGIRYVHANGNIQAKVWYSKNERIYLKQLVSRQTGNEENKYSVNINNFQINLYKTLSKFQKYDTIEKTEKLKIFSDFYLPIEITTKTNKEEVEEVVEYSKEEAKIKAAQEAKNKLDEEVSNKDNLVNIYTNYNETEEYIEAQVIYEVIEEIGTKEKIVF